MFSQSERKEMRLDAYDGVALSDNSYNLTIGGMLLYGLLVNSILIAKQPYFILDMNPMTLFISYFVLVILGSVLINRHSAALSFIGYTMIVLPIGMILTVAIPAFPVEIVKQALRLTAGITGVMMIISTLFPNVFLSMGRALFISLLVFFGVELISSFFGFMPGVYDLIAVGIFTLYIGYDWAKAQVYPRTLDNAINSACDIYLDVINLFLRLLRILSRARSND